MPTPRQRTCGPERPRGPVTNFLALREARINEDRGPKTHQNPARILVDAGLGREALRRRILRRAPRAAPPACTHFLLARARTTDERTMRRAVRRRGWLEHCTRGEYGAYAHRCGGPLSSRPLSPCPCNAAALKGPAFCFLNYHTQGALPDQKGDSGGVVHDPNPTRIQKTLRGKFFWGEVQNEDVGCELGRIHFLNNLRERRVCVRARRAARDTPRDTTFSFF